MTNLKLGRFIFSVAAVLLFSLFIPAFGTTSYAMTESVTVEVSSEPEFSTRAEIIDWRYKFENGKGYRRLYNYSTQQWVGEWEALN